MYIWPPFEKYFRCRDWPPSVLEPEVKPQPPIEPGVSCLLVAVRCSSAACSTLSAYRWWGQQISGCILLGASGSSILLGCLRVSNKNRQPNHAAGSSNKLHVQKYGSASPHLT